MTRFFCLLVCIVCLFPVLAQAESICTRAQAAAEEDEVVLLPPVVYEVTQKARLYLYTAPNDHCRNGDRFAVTGDMVFAYTSYKGWINAMYVPRHETKALDGWFKLSGVAARGTVAPGGGIEWGN